MRSRLTRGAIVVAAGLTLSLTACGSPSDTSASSGSTVSVDVGTDKPVELKTGPLKIGIFMNSMSNQWDQTLVDSAKATAASFGWETSVSRLRL